MRASRSVIRRSIEFSLTVEEADQIIMDNYDFKTTKEKIDFLKSLFNINLSMINDDQPDEITYYTILKMIIDT